MPADSPEKTFQEAAAAMRGLDFEAFFSCVDPDSLGLLLQNALALSFHGGQESAAAYLAEVMDEHPWIAEWLKHHQAVAESAVTLMQSGGDPLTQREASERHRDLVLEGQRATAEAIGAVDNLPELVGSLERRSRALLGAGSVSTSLFVGERLGDVAVKRDRATAVRHTEGGYEDGVSFRRRADLWYIVIGS